MQTVSFLFEEGDYVIMDGCNSIKGVVVASCLRGSNKTHQVSWMDGGLRNEWIEDWRLTPWEG